MSSSLKFNMKLLGSNSSIAKEMMNALLPDIEKYFDKVYAQMSRDIPDILISAIQAQPEYSALLGGTLQGEFGIPDPQNRLNEILSTIRSGQVVKRNPAKVSSNGIKGGIKLQMVKSDFSDLLSLGSASFDTEKGSRLDWLKWLLTEGDTIIISNYEFVIGPYPTSRTGLGIMRQFGGSGWRVPPEFAGTVRNNWITRAIDSASQSIESALQRVAKI